MGSFLQACSLTHQSIQEGQEVYIIPLLESRESTSDELQGLSSAIYATDMFTPLGFMFIGEYTDYGSYDINWSLASNRLLLFKYLEFLKKSSYNLEQGPNEYHDVPVKINELVLNDNYQEVWDYIHEAIWEGRLYLKSYISNTYRKVHYNVMIKHHADILIDIKLNEPVKYCNDYEKEFRQLSITEQAKVFVDKDFKPIHEFRVADLFSTYSSAICRLGSYDFQDIKEQLIETTNEDFQDLYIILKKLHALDHSLSSCNMYFMPITTGSQDYGNSLGNNYTYLMSKVFEYNVAKELESHLEYGEGKTITEEDCRANLIDSGKHLKGY